MNTSLQNTYAEVFSENFDAVKLLAEKRRKGLEEVFGLFTQRIECEAQYSKTMKIIGNTSHSLNQGSLGLGLQAFQVDCLNRADQSAEFAKSARAEVLEPIKMMLKEQETLLKSFSTKAGKSTKEIESINTNIQAAYQNYETALKEAEDVLYECERHRISAGEKVKGDAEKLNIKMEAALKRHKEAFEFYRKFSESANSHKVKHVSDLKEFMNVLEEQEKQRISIVKTALQKLFIFEACIEQNHKYDIKHVSASVEDINPGKDIEALIHHETVYNGLSQANAKVKNVDEAKKSGWSRLFELYAADYYGKEDRLIDYENIVEETKDYILHKEDAKFQEMFNEFKKLSTTSKELSTEEIEKLKAFLNERKGRIAYVDALAENIAASSDLLWEFLTCAYKEEDLELVYKAMKYGEKVKINEEKSLLQSAKEHQIWKSQKLWINAIKHEIDLEMRLQRTATLKNPPLQSSIEQKERSVVFEKLKEVLKHALNLSKEKEELSKIALEFCKFYKLTIQQIDLLNVFFYQEKLL